MDRLNAWITERRVDAVVFFIDKVTEPIAWAAMAAAVVVIVIPAVRRLWIG